jgi:hypothetical protein
MKSICIELHGQAVKTEATGLYSRKAIERLGFTVAAEFLYADYEVEIHGNTPKLTTYCLFRVGDPDPLVRVRGTDPAPDSSIIKKK